MTTISIAAEIDLDELTDEEYAAVVAHVLQEVDVNFWGLTGSIGIYHPDSDQAELSKTWPLNKLAESALKFDKSTVDIELMLSELEKAAVVLRAALAKQQ